MPIHNPLEIRNAAASLISRMPTALYRYYGFSRERLKWVEQLLVKSELYFAPYIKFNDPFDCRMAFRPNSSTLSKPEGQMRLAESLHLKHSKHGIVSLSTDPASMLMWSYYSEGHRGVAIQFNMTPENLLAFMKQVGQYLPVEVRYSHEFPCVDFYSISVPDYVQSVIGTKAKAWEHEAEWRFVLLNKTGPVRIPPGMVGGVIMGLRTDETCKRRIRQWVRERSVPTQILQITNKADSYDLQVVPA